MLLWRTRTVAQQQLCLVNCCRLPAHCTHLGSAAGAPLNMPLEAFTVTEPARKNRGQPVKAQPVWKLPAISNLQTSYLPAAPVTPA
jgi:hypothetical protein